MNAESDTLHCTEVQWVSLHGKCSGSRGLIEAEKNSLVPSQVTNMCLHCRPRARQWQAHPIAIMDPQSPIRAPIRFGGFSLAWIGRSRRCNMYTKQYVLGWMTIPGLTSRYSMTPRSESVQYLAKIEPSVTCAAPGRSSLPCASYQSRARKGVRLALNISLKIL